MKRTILLILILVILAIIIYYIKDNKNLLSSDVNIFKNDNNASEILYKYLNNDELIKLYPDKCSKQNMFAFEYDLNNDGINEIIGYPDCILYEGSLGKTLFILKKENGIYTSIWQDNFVPEGIKISSNRTNNFNDIKIKRAGLNFKNSKISDKECIIKYNGKEYIQLYNLFNKI